MKVQLIIISVLLGILVLYDLGIGKKSNPFFFTAPQLFCTTGFDGITLPPVGIFLCEEFKTNERLKTHELVHWSQYQRMGTLTFYGNYIGGWVMGGFQYKNNWMEKEAYGTAL